MAELGKFNKLRAILELDYGVYLDGEGLGEILLPRRYVPENCQIGDVIEVFIYHDSKERLVATTQKPFAIVDQFALLKVKAATDVGAFLDWNLPRDLFVPFREQKQKMVEGESYVVYVYLDEKSGRIAASSRLDKFLDKQEIDFQEGQKVNLLICDRTGLGYKAIVDNTCWGILYKNEVFQTLKSGQRIEGFIKKVRDDAKIDLCLQKSGYEKVDDISEKILDTLKAQGGFIAVSDKSSPEVVYELFGISKKNYKKAVGALYKKNIIRIEDKGIKLRENNNKPISARV
ncbi:GntR family transcriptional regulator [bacterium]|nr:GntR family transcriptional regulator [bacterium]